MTFDEYWDALNEKKVITGKVLMTADQFKRMQRQAYTQGHKEAKESGDSLSKLAETLGMKPDPLTGLFK